MTISYTLLVNQIGGADDSSVLHSLFQFFAFDEGLCGFDGGKFVGHCDVVGVVDRNALRFWTGAKSS